MSYDPTDLRGQQKAREKSEREQRLAIEELKADLQWLMGDARGRRLMWAWLGAAGIYRTSFTGDSKTFFREGMRNMGLMLQSQVMEHCPERFAEMMLEHQPAGSAHIVERDR